MYTSLAVLVIVTALTNKLTSPSRVSFNDRLLLLIALVPIRDGDRLVLRRRLLTHQRLRHTRQRPLHTIQQLLIPAPPPPRSVRLNRRVFWPLPHTFDLHIRLHYHHPSKITPSAAGLNLPDRILLQNTSTCKRNITDRH